MDIEPPTDAEIERAHVVIGKRDVREGMNWKIMGHGRRQVRRAMQAQRRRQAKAQVTGAHS